MTGVDHPGSEPHDGADEGVGARSNETGDQKAATGETSRRLTFGKEDRLRNGKEFGRVFRRGRRLKGVTLEFIWIRGESEHARLGLVVSRKSGSAVRRNRIKRLAREAFRRNRHRFPEAIDLVVRAYPRKEPVPDYPGVEKDFLELAEMLSRDRAKTADTAPNRRSGR